MALVLLYFASTDYPSYIKFKLICSTSNAQVMTKRMERLRASFAHCRMWRNLNYRRAGMLRRHRPTSRVIEPISCEGEPVNDLK